MSSSTSFELDPNLTRNLKGAIAYKSTKNPLLDFFTFGSKKLPETLEEFGSVVQMVSNCLNTDPELFVKLLLFHRLIIKGNGIKWIYYLCMIVLKENDLVLYEQVLSWSWQYPKDILTLHRHTNMYKPRASSGDESVVRTLGDPTSQNDLQRKLNAFRCQNRYNQLVQKDKYDLYNVQLQSEIVLYAKLILDVFVKLLTPGSEENVNPMLLKYLAYENCHWAVETDLIWSFLETLVEGSELPLLIKSSEDLTTELGSNLRSILQIKSDFGTEDMPLFNNKKRRKIKKLFNESVNLLDNLFKGNHKDGRPFESVDEEEGVSLIADQIKRSATLAYHRFEKTVKSYFRADEESSKPVPELTLVKDRILKGYFKYLEMLKTGKAKIKTTGLDVTELVFNFFVSSSDFDPSLESKLVDLAEKLKNSLLETAGEEEFSKLAEKFELVLDISGSMVGIPLQTGLLYMLQMAKVFKIRRLYYFADYLEVVDLTPEDFSDTMCSLVRKIYTTTYGGTNLDAVFKRFRQDNLCNKNMIILTDGDCDPKHGSNPFHNAPTSSHNNNVIVLNLNQSMMCFPHLHTDPNVCYVTGNNPKTLNGFIKALVISMKESRPITPELVLKCSLDLEELENSFEFGSYSKEFESEEISKLFETFQKNLPPKKKINRQDRAVDEGLDESDEHYDGYGSDQDDYF
jgi:hypothetical protein